MNVKRIGHVFRGRGQEYKDSVFTELSHFRGGLYTIYLVHENIHKNYIEIVGFAIAEEIFSVIVFIHLKRNIVFGMPLVKKVAQCDPECGIVINNGYQHTYS